MDTTIKVLMNGMTTLSNVVSVTINGHTLLISVSPTEYYILKYQEKKYDFRNLLIYQLRRVFIGSLDWQSYRNKK